MSTEAEASKAKLTRLKASRKSHRGVTTRYMNEADELLSRTTLDESQKERLVNLREQLKQKINLLNSLDEDIVQNCEISEIEKEVEESEVISFRLTELTTRMERALTIETRRNVREFSPGARSLNSASSDSKTYSKLPKLDMQKFNGDILKFMGFWDRFETAIDKNDDIPTIEKFNYLQYYLEGPAARNIDGLLITEANYKVAKDILQKRYGRSQLIISAHVEELLKLKPCSNEKPNQLRYIYDKISIHVGGMESLGVRSEAYGSMLIPVIMGKLPPEIRVQVARLTSADIWSLGELLNLLRREVEAREVGEATKVNEEKPAGAAYRNPTRNTATALFAETEKPKPKFDCVYCKGEHFSASCEAVKDVNKRKEILRKFGRCYHCLRVGHTSRNCSFGRNCRNCGKSHHQSICPGKIGQEYTKSRSAEESKTTNEGITENPTTSASATTRSKSRVLLQTARTVAYKPGETVGVPVRVLFDNGSQRTYVTEELQRKLNLKPVKKETVHVNTFGGDKFSKNICNVLKVDLLGVNNRKMTIQALSFPKLCSALPSKMNLEDYPHLENLHLADSFNCENDSNTVDILIGADFYYELVTGEIIKGDDGPIAISSKFGWLLSGPIKIPGSETSENEVVCNLIIEGIEPKTSENDVIANELKRFWETESIGINEIKESPEFLNNIKHENGRYEVGLPWKQVNSEPLNDNYSLALNRLNLLWSRLEKNSDIMNEYDNIITDQLKTGILEEVPAKEQSKEFIDKNNVHFLSHFGVVRKDSETTKLRIVFDGSAKGAGQELSINDYLENGPNMIPPVFDILTKFRSYPIALVSDVEKAFLQISIKENDRNALRFLWYENSKDGEKPKLVQLRFRRLVWGLKPSPSILGHVINEHLKKFENVKPEVAELLQNQLFVDDFVGGVKSVEEGVEVYDNAKAIMKSGGFNLRKWKSSSPELNEIIDQKENPPTKTNLESVREDDESYVKDTLGPSTKENDHQSKILGLNWHITEDSFFFNFEKLIEYANSLPPTKRSVLKLTAKIYDPMGFLSPVTIALKQMFQSLCVNNVNWDDKLEGDFRRKFDSIVFGLARLHNLKIPRCLFDKQKNVKQYELHGFSDASSYAYAAVVYLLTRYDDGSISVNLIASKSRIAPINKQTIPRLELLGAVILSRLMKGILASLETVLKQNLDCFYWVDSNVALCWIRNEKLWKTYVQNRINEIHKNSKANKWGFCPGTLNPADLPSRGIKPNDLVSNELWWHGPEFLRKAEKDWPKPPIDRNAELKADEEIVKQKEPLVTHVLVNTETENSAGLLNVIQINRFSSKSKLIRTVAWILRFIAKLKSAVKKEPILECYRSENLSFTEIENSEIETLKSIQKESFPEELLYLKTESAKSKVPRLVKEFGIFIDDKGLLRCRTRLKNANVPCESKTPILLRGNNNYSDLVIKEVHSNVAHSGVRHTLSVIRERYWILKGREATKRIVRKCFICKKFGGIPYSTLQAHDLPSFRVDDAPPFSNIGIDFAGPLFVSKNDIESKVYICLFTCASTRALHLELVESLDTTNFLRCFRRFAARRGLPRLIVSDNAKTFKAGSKEIKNIVRSNVVKEFFVKKGIEWRYIPELSPWFGAFWERLVGSVKRCLRRVIGQAKLTYDELQTIIVEVEGIVNSRPLTYVYNDSEGVSFALTPSHLIYGRRVTNMPSDTVFEIVSTNEALTKRAKHHQKLLEQFTNIWRQEYLLNLRERVVNKIATKRPEIKKGDIVLLKNDKTKRTFWKLARVQQLLPGGDGEVRVALVKMLTKDKKSVIVRRSITHLIPMEIEVHEEDIQSKPSTEDVVDTENKEERPRRTAKTIGEMLRRNNFN